MLSPGLSDHSVAGGEGGGLPVRISGMSGAISSSHFNKHNNTPTEPANPRSTASANFDEYFFAARAARSESASSRDRSGSPESSLNMGPAGTIEYASSHWRLPLVVVTTMSASFDVLV